jgi:predicted  nucleic acid-binding Zn-ribbon protein
MSTVIELRGRAERCRSASYTLPVVTTVEEARALGRRIADQLANISGRDALLSLAALDDVQTVLAARLARLEEEMTATRRELRQVNAAVQACRRYGASSSGSDPAIR